MYQQPITPHSDHPSIPLSPNLVGLLGALGDVNDLEGCEKKSNCQHMFSAESDFHIPKLYFIFKFPNFNTRRRSGAIATYQGEGTA
jgi:hypothetical protein